VDDLLRQLANPNLHLEPGVGPYTNVSVSRSSWQWSVTPPFSNLLLLGKPRGNPIPLIEVVEPLFMNLDAEVEITPVMSADDLRKGLAKASQT
jgi:hypothetical protein